ncbi:uncharacterized protein [Musca autumnalis]|uniref:uncharacterized protein n=1 Tax=Musca autumnalis TaxID=221902 RepID=UPI003CED25B2
MSHQSQNWMDVLPTVMLGLRASIREDTNTSLFELTYGKSERLPGDMIVESEDRQPTEDYVISLKAKMQALKPVPANHKTNRSVFVSKHLDNCNHVYVRRDAVRKYLQRPYDGPFRVLYRSDKPLTLDVNGKEKVISIDRVKPAFIFNPDITEDPKVIAIPISTPTHPTNESSHPTNKSTLSANPYTRT